MALRVVNAAFTSKGYTAEPSSGIHQGMVVALEASASGSAEVAKANRDGTHGLAQVCGIAYDDAASTGNTRNLVDPVTLEISAVYARRIGDYQNELIENQFNFTDTGTAKRPISVLSVGGEFGSDQYSSTYIVNSVTADTTGTPGTTPGQVYTYGAGSDRAGSLVADDDVTGGTADADTPSLGVASVTTGVSNSLLWFRWIGP